MAKEKLTDETLIDKCSNESCQYNEKSFCKIHSIMIDEEGKCIYARKRNVKSNSTETTVG
jgi:hypothetical protein